MLFPQDGLQLYDNSLLHEISIEFQNEEFWDELTSSYEDNAQFSGSDIPYVMDYYSGQLWSIND